MLRRLKEVLLVVHGSEGDWVLTLPLPPPGSHVWLRAGEGGCEHGSCWPARQLLGQKTIRRKLLGAPASRQSLMRGKVSFHGPA